MKKNVLLNALAVGLLFVATGFAQQPVMKQLGMDAAQAFSFKHVGFLECARCHNHPAPPDLDRNVPEFISLNEYQTWLNEDPHARAYLNIVPDRTTFESVRKKLMVINEQANGMADMLSDQQREKVEIPGWDESSNQRSLDILMAIGGASQEEVGRLFQEITAAPVKLIQQDELSDFPPALVAAVKQCMNCHAGVDQRRNDFDLKVFEYGTGVSCEACHGPASEWLDPHKDSRWRTKSPQEKGRLGLYNTRQPVARSELCLSCHIGNVDQGRVVTHGMYAAGHPPLPGIEIESYADQIPRHWRHVSEKIAKFEWSEEYKDLLAADLGLSSMSQVEEEYPRTKNLLVSGVLASAKSVDLLSKSAGEYLKLQHDAAAATPHTELNPWPEYAAFDCAACHHDLKTTGSLREFAGIPGRPPAPYWPRSLSKPGLAWLSTRHEHELMDDFLKQQQGLQDALNGQPFGNPDQLHAAGSTYSEFLTEIAQRIQSTPLTRDDAIDVLELLCGAEQNSDFNPTAETRDFHSARQIGWAIQVVCAELAQDRHSGQPQLSHEFVSNDKALSGVLSEMRQYLILDLAPTGEITPLQKKYLYSWRDFDRNRFTEIIERFSAAFRESERTTNSR